MRSKAKCSADAAAARCHRLHFLAYCIKKGEESGLFNRPAPSGGATMMTADQIKAIPDGQTVRKAAELMKQSKLSYSFAVQYAQNIARGAKIAKLIAGAIEGFNGLDDSIVTDLQGFPEIAEAVMEMNNEIKGLKQQLQEINTALKDENPADAMRMYIAMVMAQRGTLK